ncbi:MAG TPA: hypothetical protein VFV19_06715 [Candidatus Polarisedimenticolaceae bacterium]|nr:hypothetical protein [Candidatus Polarisedimenticolaceae bacterium]
MIVPAAALVLLAAAPAVPPLPPDYPFNRPAPSCPAYLSVWTSAGSLQAGDDWDAVLLEIRSDRARLTDISLRAAIPRMPTAEADWFLSDPLDPEASAFSVATRTYSGKPLDDLCQSLVKAGMTAVTSRAAADLKVDGKTLLIENLNAGAILNDRDGRVGALAKPPDPRPPERLPVIPYDEQTKPGPGTLTQPALDAKQTSQTERRDVSPKDPDPDHPADPERVAHDDAERKALDAARDIVWRQARGVHPTAGDLEDIPASRRMLARMAELDVEGLPKGLPSDFILATLGAPKDYVTALAIDVLNYEDNTDRLAALRWLGDMAAPSAVDDLIALLRKRPDGKQLQEEQALALRALLKASPDQARMQALRLLTAPRRVCRAAMGVFYFTEPALRRELTTLDFSNPDKVKGMAARIRGHLTVNARDPDLKKAAAGVQSALY